MDKNSVIGLVLIGLLLVAYTIYQRPSDVEIAEQKRLQDSITAVQTQIEADKTVNSFENTQTEAPGLVDTTEGDSLGVAVKNEALKLKYGVLAGSSEGTASDVEITTELLKIKFSNKGGVPVRAELKDFTSYDSLPLILFDETTANLGMEFTYPSLGNFNTRDFYFKSNAEDEKLSGDDVKVLVYELTLGDGRKVENRYTIKGNSYDIGFETNLYDAGGVVTSPKIIWEMSSLQNEKGIDMERNNSTIFYKELDNGRDYLSETSDDTEEIDEEKLQWLAFKQDFFSTILIGNAPFGKGSKLESYPYPEENDSLSQYFKAIIPLESNGSGTVFSAQLYMGPNDYKILKEYGMELDKIINLGWGIFGWVNKYLVIPIFDWLGSTGLSYGIIILILTLIIKMILMPLTWKNYLSSAKMRVLKPEIEELNEKHKDAEPMKKQQATMELYRKTGVSPFAGCIPMIIQMPILYAMFRFFPSSIQLRHEPFLWADDLSAYDSIATLPFNIPAYGDHVSLFTILMCISTLIYTVYNSSNMPTQSQPGMPNMKVIMYIFPFMMLFFFNGFASGLSYYYFLANVISIFQMIAIKKFFIDEDKIKLQIAENKKKKGKKGKSKFQRKLEDMAKQRGMNT
ncbi:membrane protein insertase YidC [Cryomorpha ignava]|uniref:Membrane protein insertase YidC n=1 Tax=Cryomorpha ignava TaxID=101383 RepID=A0A7K3WML2_9FLAO|nr:membrane protein insertase YidC [Cryomorpha ignava]NEN22887.1 membrane protein insertase YidC [Cryomorpha ignava]